MRFPASPDAPAFSPREWTNRPAPLPSDPEAVEGVTLTGANCYQYAIAGSNPDGSNRTFNEVPPNPGHLGGIDHPIAGNPEFSAADLRELVELDGLIFAGAEPMPDNPDFYSVPPAREGYYLVGIYHKNTVDVDGNRHVDFHLTRQDRDGGWSGKPGFSAYSDIARFLEPAEDGGYRPLPRLDGEIERGNFYTFAGYAYVPRGGIDAGLEHPIAEALIIARDNYESAPGVERLLRTDAQRHQTANEVDRAHILHYLNQLADTIRDKYGSDIAQTFIDMGNNQLSMHPPLPTPQPRETDTPQNSR